MNASIVKAYEHGDRWVVGVSGGKDSSATCLYLLKHGLVKGDFERVFLDNGWEYPQTYEYIETLSETIGEIKTLRADIKVKEDHVEIVKTIEEMLGRESPFIRVILNYTMFPTRYRKMCTERTKLFVLRDYYRTFEDDPLSITGIRREESRMRAKSEEFEWNKKLMCYTWKPILDWTTQDVVDIHKHFGLAPNPLYLSKYDRVSCYPCIFANKSQIRNIGEKRRKIITLLEEYINDYLQDTGIRTYFLRNTPFKEVYDWSLTAHGGKQYSLLDIDPPKCQMWGLCGT